MEERSWGKGERSWTLRTMARLKRIPKTKLLQFVVAKAKFAPSCKFNKEKKIKTGKIYIYLVGF